VSLEEEAQVIPKTPESHPELKLDPEAEKTISKSIKDLSSSFNALLKNLKNELKEVDIADVVEYLEENGLDYLPFDDLKTAKDFRDFINKVNEHYDFLDCSLLQLIAEEFATDALSEKFEEHSNVAAEFRESHTVDDLKYNLTEIFNPYLDDFEKGPIARIDLNNAWNGVQLSRLRTLIGCFFPDIKIKRALTKHVLIKCRSVHITYYMTESADQIQQIIACARERVDFMKHIGLYHLAINGEVILNEAEKKDFKFESALQEAAKVGDSEAVEVLLEIGRGTDVLGDISKALFHASSNNHYRVVKLFLNEGANPNVRDTDGESAMHAASRKGHHKIVELLLKEKADPNTCSNNGITTLMLASFNNCYQVIKLLLKEKVNPNIQTKNGTTALMLASQSGHTESAELLLKAGADPDIKEEEGWTALMIACQSDHTKVAQLLLENKADPNICSNDGRTALMSASFNNCHQVVELLLKEKVDPNIQ
ncbi:PREDICTED: ankyrin-1-like, partial [Amphimedon queenslandica]